MKKKKSFNEVYESNRAELYWLFWLVGIPTIIVYFLVGEAAAVGIVFLLIWLLVNLGLTTHEGI